MTKKIALIGAGVWGTALSLAASRSGCEVLVWAREGDVVNDINEKHCNTRFLPNKILPDTIKATSQIQDLFEFSDDILLTVSAQYTRSVLQSVKPFIKPCTTIILCAKGIENPTGKMLSEILKEELPDTKFAVLSGPGFAIEVADEKPTATTIAAENITLAHRLSEKLFSKHFRPYATDDIISPQIGGSVKNVLAIASGIVEGCQLGDNARAALLTRGINEMIRLARALGGHSRVMMGMCGLGDLVLTASCHQSRNFSFGYELGQTKNASKMLEENNKTVEGIFTSAAVIERAKSVGLELPICETIYDVLYNNIGIDEAMELLLTRPLKDEGF